MSRGPAPRNMPRGPRGKFNPNTFKRIIKMLFKFYPVMMPLTIVCILFSAVTAALPAVFQQKVIADIEIFIKTGDWEAAKSVILPKVFILIGLYIVSIIAITLYNQLMVFITQGFLNKMRIHMFKAMQNLPIKYFDQNKHGDIMSHYTNDVDTMRELISRSLPSLLQAAVIVISVLSIMLYYSVWMTLVVLLGVITMAFVSKKVGGGSAKYFMRQQKAIGKTEGFVQEMMSGQKVIKVFCHEKECNEDFDKVNNELFNDSFRAHAYANCLGPIIGNLGNILYVLVATVGGVLLLTRVPNISIGALVSGSVAVLTIDLVVPFLNMSRQFTGNINQVTQQINTVVMAMAGAERVFSLIDQQPEADEGYVTLVNCEIDADGNITETDKRTGHWAWKHPHSDGTLTYELLKGDVTMTEVDFGYEEDKLVLHDVSVYARPGQKVAFVGATGAGKTTITNLINRFYDIEDGKIRYDGININKIKKSDLRRSLGIVLQETNLFTGTVMDNIRYGRLDATDEECISAAKLAGADDFITRLPQGYETQLSNNGSNLSQGQRQLIAIARAAVADPPVMILDEATSSIDTRTEAIVQKGMDKLMEGRTVFVIAHRLSTVMNSDVIMVLDKGKIIERGSHADLIAQKGTYYQLYTGSFELE
ncbi:MAG: ABC transporter ATP-binding protein [Ruminococcaceae bacterium]|nr:ABC transporter ATP-binding protein [Oscillospiraceae bacterium]